MIDPMQFERLIWIAKHPGAGNKPPPGLFGVTTWPQEMSEAVQAAIDEIERLVDVLERDIRPDSNGDGK
jgi:hypothetical protein